MDLTVEKHVVGSTAEGTFPFIVTFMDADGNVVLPADGTGYTVERDATKCTCGEVAFDLSHEGSMTIQGIKYGSIAYITETDHTGYSVHVEQDAVEISQSDTVDTLVMDADKDLIFYNKAGYTLPGTYPVVSLGLAMMLLSACMLIARKRNRNCD